MNDSQRPTATGLPVVPTPPVLDDQAKVSAAKSPTGEPKVKPSAVKWWLAGTVGAIAGLELCAQQAPNPTVQLICRIGAVALGAFVGSASPGFRKR
jgi:hypothetical protein